MSKVLVRGDENIKGLIGGIEQGAVVEFCPNHFIGCRYRVTGQSLTEGCRSAMIEENSHINARTFCEAQTSIRLSWAHSSTA